MFFLSCILQNKLVSVHSRKLCHKKVCIPAFYGIKISIHCGASLRCNKRATEEKRVFSAGRIALCCSAGAYTVAACRAYGHMLQLVCVSTRPIAACWLWAQKNHSPVSLIELSYPEPFFFFLSRILLSTCPTAIIPNGQISASKLNNTQSVHYLYPLPRSANITYF